MSHDIMLQQKAELADLNEDEKSQLWKYAVILYSAALPFVFMMPFLFYFTQMNHDVLCTLAENGFAAMDAAKKATYNTTTDCVIEPKISTGASSAYLQCQNQYNLDPSLASCKEIAGWRWPAYLCSIFVPQVFILVEFAFNRIQMPAKMIWLPILLCFLYLLTTLIG